MNQQFIFFYQTTEWDVQRAVAMFLGDDDGKLNELEFDHDLVITKMHRRNSIVKQL